MWCIKHFISNFAAASLASRLYLKSGSPNKPEGRLFSWKEVVNHLLETYAIDDVIAETENGHSRIQEAAKYDAE